MTSVTTALAFDLTQVKLRNETVVLAPNVSRHSPFDGPLKHAQPGVVYKLLKKISLD